MLRVLEFASVSLSCREITNAATACRCIRQLGETGDAVLQRNTWLHRSGSERSNDTSKRYLKALDSKFCQNEHLSPINLFHLFLLSLVLLSWTITKPHVLNQSFWLGSHAWFARSILRSRVLGLHAHFREWNSRSKKSPEPNKALVSWLLTFLDVWSAVSESKIQFTTCVLFPHCNVQLGLHVSAWVPGCVMDKDFMRIILDDEGIFFDSWWNIIGESTGCGILNAE